MTPVRTLRVHVALAATLTLWGFADAIPGQAPVVRRLPRKDGRYHWVGSKEALVNTSDTTLTDGVLAFDGRYALIVNHVDLPALAPTYTTFTVSVARAILN